MAAARSVKTDDAEKIVIVVTDGTLEGGGQRYAVGDTISVSPDEAERLLGKGVVERVHSLDVDAGGSDSL